MVSPWNSCRSVEGAQLALLTFEAPALDGALVQQALAQP